MMRSKWTNRMRLAVAGMVAIGLVALSVGPVPGAEAQEPPGLARAIEAKERNVAALMANPGVVGVGVAVDAQGEPVVRVLLARPGVSGVPAAVDRVRVETVVSGLIRAYCHTTTDDCDPAPLSVSIGHPDVTAGTLGALVTDGTDVFILSNNHVIADVNNASVGDAVLQPGTADGGSEPADTIGTLAQFVPIDFSGGANSVDAAVALTSENLVDNESLPSLAGSYGTPTTTPLAASLGLSVQKCGRTTGCTTGTVSEVSLTVSVCYETAGPFRCKTSALFTNQIGITDGSFSSPGDSGSLIVDTVGSPDPVGLLFAGSSTRTIANHIDDVLTSLNVTMFDGNITPNTPPTITSTPNEGPIAEGAPYAYDVDATDPEGQAITYGLQSGPPGMVIDNASGLVSWTPGDTDAGVHPVTVRATDALGAFHEQSYTVTVDEALNASPTAVITAPPDGVTVSSDEQITFTSTASDSEDGDVTPSITWTSDLDGPFGTGGSVTTTLTLGTHVVTASATDSGAATGSDFVTVNVVGPGNATVTLTDLGSVNNGRTWVGRVQIAFSDVSSVTWSWSTGSGGTCTSSPCAVDTGDLRKNVGSSTLSIDVDPPDYNGPAEITVSKP